MSTVIQDRTFLPEPTAPSAECNEPKPVEVLAAKLNEVLEQEDSPRPVLKITNGSTVNIDLPEPFLEVLQQVATAMSQGLAVSIVPHNLKMSTQEAADLLGISRPTLVRMLEEGKIPFEQQNRHRRIYLIDLMEYQKRQRRISREALDDMVAETERLGLYDIDPEEFRAAVRAARGKPN